MRHGYLAGRAGIVGVFVAGLLAACGCGRQEPEYATSRNLGDAPGELMPVAVAPADPRILEDQKGVTKEALGPAKRRIATEAGEEVEEDKPTGRGTRGPRGRADRRSGPAQDQPPSAEKAAKNGGPTEVAASPLAAKAQQFVQSLAGGKFDQAAKDFGPQMRQAMPVAQLQAVWQGVVAQLGPFRATRSGTEGQEGGLTTVLVPTEFSRGMVRVKVVYDQKGEMAGLWLEPPGGPPGPSAEPKAEKADSAKTTEGAVDFSAYGVELPVPEGWKVLDKGQKGKEVWCVIQKTAPAKVKPTIGLWAGESYIKNAPKTEDYEAASPKAAAWWACQQAIAHAQGRPKAELSSQYSRGVMSAATFATIDLDDETVESQGASNSRRRGGALTLGSACSPGQEDKMPGFLKELSHSIAGLPPMDPGTMVLGPPVEFPALKIKFNVPPGWEIIDGSKDRKGKAAWCAMQQKTKNESRPTICVYVGDSFVQDAPADGARKKGSAHAAALWAFKKAGAYAMGGADKKLPKHTIEDQSKFKTGGVQFVSIKAEGSDILGGGMCSEGRKEGEIIVAGASAPEDDMMMGMVVLGLAGSMAGKGLPAIPPDAAKKIRAELLERRASVKPSAAAKRAPQRPKTARPAAAPAKKQPAAKPSAKKAPNRPAF